MDHNKSHHEVTAHREIKEKTQDKRELSGPLSTEHLLTKKPEHDEPLDIFSKAKLDKKKSSTTHERFDTTHENKLDTNEQFDPSHEKKFGTNEQFDTAHEKKFGPNEQFDPSREKKFGTNEQFGTAHDITDHTKKLDTNEHLNDHFDTTKLGTTSEYFEASHENKLGTTHEHSDDQFDIYNDKNGLNASNYTDKKKQRSPEILTTKASETDSSQHNKELTTTNDEHKDEKDFVSSTRHHGEATDRNNSSDPSDASFDPSDVNKGNQKNTILGMLKEQLSYTNLFPDMSPQDNGTNNHETENTHHQPHSAEVLNEVLPNHEEAVDNYNATHEDEHNDEIPPPYEVAVKDAPPPHEKVANNHEVPNEPPPSYKEVVHNDEDPHDTTPSHERTVNPHEVKTDAPPAHEQAVRDNNLSSRRETDKRHTNNSTSKVVSVKAGNKSRGK